MTGASGGELRAERKSRGLTLKEVAKEIAWSVPVLESIEKGTKEVNAYEAYRIYAAMDRAERNKRRDGREI